MISFLFSYLGGLPYHYLNISSCQNNLALLYFLPRWGAGGGEKGMLLQIHDGDAHTKPFFPEII